MSRLLVIPFLLLFTPLFSQSTGTGPLISWYQTDDAWIGNFPYATVRIRSVADSILQFAFDDYADTPTAMIKTPIPTGPSLSVSETTADLTVTNQTLSITIRKSDGFFTFHEAGGALLASESSDNRYKKEADTRQFSFQSGNEQVFGFGEKGTSVNRKGQTFDTYNRANYGYGHPLSTMKINIPLMITTAGYGVFYDSWWAADVDLQTDLTYKSRGGPLVMYFFSGSIQQQIRHYYTLTGYQPLPPRWALGYIQSKYGYQNESEVRSIASTFREKHIPLDVIILDLYWFGQENKMGDLQWDLTRFPDPDQLIADLKADEIRIVPIQELYLTQGTRLYTSLADYVGKRSDGNPYTFGFWTGNARLFDITHPNGPALWWAESKKIMEDGIAGWWTDLGEPENHPWDMVHAGGSEAKVHNTYNLLWAKTLFDGFQTDFPDQRFFNLTRSGTGGMQRYATFPWSGDVDRSFNGLAVQLPIMLGMTLSGQPYEHSDLGGFAGAATTPELYTRWMQFGAFCGIMRAHTAHQNQEPWAFGSEAETITSNFIRIRSSLNPYLYTAAFNHSMTGHLFIRPLFMDYPEWPGAADRTDGYLFGDHFLVFPVVENGKRSINAELPPGNWYDFWYPNASVDQGLQSLNAPLAKIPVLVKAGSIVPSTPAGKGIMHQTHDTLIVSVYPDLSTGLASGELVEDDGVTLQAMNGTYLRTTFSWTEVSADSLHGTFSLLPEGNGWSGMPDNRVILLKVINHGSWSTVKSGGANLAESGDSLSWMVSADQSWFQTATHGYVRILTNPDEAVSVTFTGPVRTSIEEEQPATFHVGNPYPNPFNPEVSVPVSVSAAGLIDFTVYNLLGQPVYQKSVQFHQAGDQVISWMPAQLSSGTYLAVIRSGKQSYTRRLVYIR